MNKKKIIAAGIIVLALTGIGSGAALAATPVAPTATAAVVDPSTPGTTEAPESESAVETPGSEAATPDDGNDGGHADPEGVDVNHEGGADEK
ncbi:hypothetical protein [Cryobacterium sp. TMS1-13-1]|uniref:hypothetical protein n=1 Tax=Cryobacterium sp. TMS1-13-1 TaxID=1259220 RepID=UPI0010690215|nr:hypothetical protein [Cryobacterium sp. TMS1-13-1]TFD21373.1 hypothetical protein E3T31_11160 [Cryobacterium sp. TMS1-13-1]